MIRSLYDWVIRLAAHPRAVPALGVISFLESSVFPIPPDVMLIPMVLANRTKAFTIAAVCTVTSVVGGLLGYAIGYYAFETIGEWVVRTYHLQAGLEAFEYCRAGKGPIILEMKTYRYRGHSMSDPAKYRSKEELTEMREKRDPIENFGKKLIERGLVNEQDLKQMDAEVKRVVVEAAEFATESPEPAISELYTEIYA